MCAFTHCHLDGSCGAGICSAGSSGLVFLCLGKQKKKKNTTQKILFGNLGYAQDFEEMLRAGDTVLLARVTGPVVLAQCAKELGLTNKK